MPLQEIFLAKIKPVTLQCALQDNVLNRRVTVLGRMMALSGAGCAWEIRGVRRLRLGGLGNVKEHNHIRTAWTASNRIQLLDSARRRSLKRGGRAVCNRTCGSRRVAVNSAVGRGWNGSEIGSADGQHGEPWHVQPYWFRAGTALGREVALEPGSRASWAILIEEGWHLQQREGSDDETPR